MRFDIDISDLDPRARVLADHYGLDHQLRKLHEECLELAGAVSDHLREQKQESKWDLICEMADVLFVMEQIAYKLVVSRPVFDSIIGYKYQRQLNRIKGENAEKAYREEQCQDETS